MVFDVQLITRAAEPRPVSVKPSSVSAEPSPTSMEPSPRSVEPSADFPLGLHRANMLTVARNPRKADSKLRSLVPEVRNLVLEVWNLVLKVRCPDINALEGPRGPSRRTCIGAGIFCLLRSARRLGFAVLKLPCETLARGSAKGVQWRGVGGR